MVKDVLEPQPEDTEAKRIEETRREFFSGIGKCITFWAGIEAALFDLFCVILATKAEYSNYIFWSIPTFSMRLSYTSGLTGVYLKSIEDKQSLQEWTAIQKRLSDLYSIRNKLAHQPIIEDTYIHQTTVDGNILILEIPEENPRIVPNENDAKQTFDPIDNAMLSAHYNAIAHLDFDLNNFIGEIRAMRELESLRKETEHK